jgi:hypothetical protein
MSTIYDGTLLDHLAEHIRYLSTASSFWFSVNSSYDHVATYPNKWVCPHRTMRTFWWQPTLLASPKTGLRHQESELETLP